MVTKRLIKKEKNMKYIHSFEIPILYFSFVVLLESIGGFGGYGVTSNAFIFSLNNSKGLAPFMSKVTGNSDKLAIYRHSDYGPSFGDDLIIHAKIGQSRARLGSHYSVPTSVKDKDKLSILKGPGTYFLPDKVEVFYLGSSR